MGNRMTLFLGALCYDAKLAYLHIIAIASTEGG